MMEIGVRKMAFGITRASWENGNAACLSKGRAGNARVWRVETPEGAFVIKDFSKSPWWIRWTWGRWMIGHEYRLLKALEGLEGVPQKVFRVDAYAFGMEFLEGISLGDRNQHWSELGVGHLPTTFFFKLERLVCAMHRRGVAHLDTRNAKNVMVLPGDKPALVDFQSGVRIQKWFPRWVKRLLWVSDLSSVYKHYYRHYHDGADGFKDGPNGFPESRARILLGMLKLRKLWVFRGYSFISTHKLKPYETALMKRYAAKGGTKTC